MYSYHITSPLLQDCQPEADGKSMICQSPNISAGTPDSPSWPVLVDVHFHMDGVANLTAFSDLQPELSRFHYFPDPRFFPFEGDDGVRYMYQNENFLDILVSSFRGNRRMMSDIIHGIC